MGMFLLLLAFLAIVFTVYFIFGQHAAKVTFSVGVGLVALLIALGVLGLVVLFSESQTKTTTSADGSTQPPVVSETVQPTPTSQYPTGKCVTESGVQICDLSYQGTSDGGGTRAVTMQGNEIICHDITTGLNSDIRGDSTTLNADPEFCASDYGSIYIDPTIDVSKYYGDIQSNGQNYAVPSTESTCIWAYEGGSAAIPYIQAGSYIGPDLSYDQVHAFCQSVSNRLDIFTASQ